MSNTGQTDLPAPRRMFFPHIDANNWRDYAGMNQQVLLSAFPSITMEFMNDWQERGNLSTPFVMDRVVFADRAAAMHGINFLKTQRTAANAFALPGSVNWWLPIRNAVVGFARLGVEEDKGGVDGVSGKAVITYVSRQGWGRRMLIPEDHDRLVRELYQLRDTYGYEVNVVSMDKLSRVEQLRLAGRTTVIVLFSFRLSRKSDQYSFHFIDYDGRSRKRSHFAALDETDTSVDRHGVLLPWWFRS